MMQEEHLLSQDHFISSSDLPMSFICSIFYPRIKDTRFIAKTLGGTFFFLLFFWVEARLSKVMADACLHKG